jgi:hypothetical protein
MAAPDEMLVSSTVNDRGVPGEWRLLAVERLERQVWAGPGR